MCLSFAVLPPVIIVTRDKWLKLPSTAVDESDSFEQHATECVTSALMAQNVDETMIWTLITVLMLLQIISYLSRDHYCR